MKVALVHYWLTGMRGGEKVLETLCEMYPQADIYTHVYAPGTVSDTIRRHAVRTTFINKLPRAEKMYQRYLPFMPFALEQLDLRGYDLVISSESGPAKGVILKAETTHVCYCHSPMRYLWDMYQEYLASAGCVTRLAFRLFSYRLRQWDALSALRVDHFVANSNTVAARIKKHYRREATVINPPVDVDAFAPCAATALPPDAPYLCFGELVPYKRVDLAIEACVRSNRRLVVVGDGPERKKLQATAGPGVEFTGRLDFPELRKRIAECKALIFPGLEDFGIIPLEVQAAGKPVIAYAAGGALETVENGKTGIFFTEQTAANLINALETFESQQAAFDAEYITGHAREFSKERFKHEFSTFIHSVCPAAAHEEIS
ncbi:MAG: D-inositol-3-phosphate glycosyltransferase [Desulfovibrio sp.]